MFLFNLKSFNPERANQRIKHNDIRKGLIIQGPASELPRMLLAYLFIIRMK